MGTSLAIYEKVENPIAFCESMAETCAAITGVSPAQGKGVALTCLCEGITPHEYARTYHNIQGKSSMRADAMLAMFRTKHGGKHRIVERSPNRAAIVLTNAEGDDYEASFSWEDAQDSRWPWKDPDKRDKGLKDNWSTSTDKKNMLWARLVSDSIRAFCPEVVAGIYTPEEIADLDVVDTNITTAAAKPVRSAAEAMAMASGNGNGSGQAAITSSATEEPPFEVAKGDAEDAEFVPTSPGKPPVEEGFATTSQVERLSQLREELSPPQNVWDEALKKRGASTVHGLTQANAQDLIDKLVAQKSRRKAEPAGKN